jgi:hypothetical protein
VFSHAAGAGGRRSEPPAQPHLGKHNGGRLGSENLFFPSCIFVVWRFFMKTYYQVCANFKLFGGSPKLENLSLNSTFVYFPFLVRSGKSSVSFSKFFRTTKEAGKYINYLFSRYPGSSARRPVLVEEQQQFSFGL